MPANPRPFRILKARTFARWTKREGLADGDRWVFMFGFAMNERDNIADKELKLIKDLASVYLAMDEPMLKRAITAGELVEIRHGKQETA